MKKVVVNLDLHDDREKKKAMKVVSTLHGIESIAIDMKEKKLTVVGDIDPVNVVAKLRKQWQADILTVGPAKEEKKEEKKEEGKKGEKKEGDKKEQEKKVKDANEQIAELINAYRSYHNPYNMNTNYYHHRVVSAEENPNSCTIC